MADLKSYDLPLYRQGLGKLGELQESFSQQMDKNNNIPSFIAQFLSGGYDTADALKRLSNEGLIRPQSRWNYETQSADNPRAQMLGDVLSASALPSALFGAGQLVTRAGGRGTSALYNKLFDGGTSIGRREFIKKGGALIGSAAVGVPALSKLFSKEAAPIAEKVASAAGKKYKFNNLKEYNDYLTSNAEKAYQSAFSRPGIAHWPDEDMYKEILFKERDAMYGQVKSLKKYVEKFDEQAAKSSWNDGPDMSDIAQRDFEENIYKSNQHLLEEFSPKAKKEMKGFKEYLQQSDAWDDVGNAFDKYLRADVSP